MPRPRAKDHDAKRHRLLREAARLFAEQGVDGASMSQLAQACGVSKAAIYHYYPGKDALLFDVLDSYLHGLRDQVVAVPLDGAPDADLHALIAAILRAYAGSDNEHRVQQTGLSALPDAQQAVLRGYQRDLVMHMSRALTRTAPDAFAGDARKLREATMAVFGMLNWFYMWNRDETEDARASYARTVADMVLGGVPRI
ncbi:AcrR family transcriptional regulator [Rubricella aquisinus]|uniref:AcrR family transcriptional regulator n=1 Tax=Rubricella aquisinus TaxID=2028108 RepID=A0A840WGB5_9RHOB|nr:TetR/AcrR family transcriptional regulator [Rubricella aquisinus]MBB5514189.1 AcrR family transcriptional regulator [Rubricella aquisinus]